MKRDIATGPKKGVAGLRIGVESEEQTANDSDNSTVTADRQSVGPDRHSDGQSNSSTNLHVRQSDRQADDGPFNRQSDSQSVRRTNLSDQSGSEQNSSDVSSRSEELTHQDGGGSDQDSEPLDGGEDSTDEEVEEVSSQLVILGISQTTRSSTL